MRQLFSRIKKLFKQHPWHYSILLTLLTAAFFVRVYRLPDLLYFFFDQGRDALRIQQAITQLDLPLVGPTTGLAGILRGPTFYYLLLPAYLVSGGSPIAAAVWLQLINIVGLFFIYLSARKLFSQRAGLLAVFLTGFSRHLVGLSRWLSNPSPIFTSVPIMLFGLLKIKDQENPHFWWPIVSLMVGLNLQFEIASEIWFIPAILLLILLVPKLRPNKKTGLISVAVFFATLLPQILFDLIHQGIMRQAVIEHFAQSQKASFMASWPAIKERLIFYFDSFQRIFTPNHPKALSLLLLTTPFFLIKRSSYRRFRLLLVLLLFPLFILLFYQGNQGNFYSYYLIGLFPLTVVLFAGILDRLFSKKILLIIPLLFLAAFSYSNLVNLRDYLAAGVDGETHISLGNQLQAIDWIYQDADSREFNVDVYVPPVIPHAYDYLFLWYGQKEYGRQPTEQQASLFYTLYEVDQQKPHRLRDWLQRQKDIGKIEQEVQFGGIHIQRRRRLP